MLACKASAIDLLGEGEIVPVGGFEPPKPKGSGFTDRRRSPTLQHWHNKILLFLIGSKSDLLAVCIFSGTEGIRTLNFERDKLAF